MRTVTEQARLKGAKCLLRRQSRGRQNASYSDILMMMLKYMKAAAATRRDAKTQLFITATPGGRAGNIFPCRLFPAES